jgi:hypothetical protein
MFELFAFQPVQILEKVMVYNKHRQVKVLFQIDYFQLHVFYQIKDFKKKNKILFTRIEDYGFQQ